MLSTLRTWLIAPIAALGIVGLTHCGDSSAPVETGPDHDATASDTREDHSFDAAVSEGLDNGDHSVSNNKAADAAVDRLTDVAPDAPTQPHRVSGVVQKGPFIRGTTVTLQELDTALVPTGRSFTVETLDDLGRFDIPVNFASSYVEIIASGYYFDELSGKLSVSQLTLRTLSEISSDGSINVNLLTSLAARRERALVTGGMSFSAARPQAEGEVLQALGFAAATTTFDRMDVSHAGSDNAILLATSLLFEKLGYLRNPTSPVAELSQVLADFGNDLAADGIYNDAATASTLRCIVPKGIDAGLVRSNIEARFGALDAGTTAPAFEPLLAPPTNCCTPSALRCNVDTAQKCDGTGRWQVTAACTGGAPACLKGRCESLCTAGNHRCDGNVAQTCDAGGRWQDGGACAWGTPTVLDPGNNNYYLTLAGNARGDVMAAWVQGIHLRTIRYSPQVGWGSIETIDRSNGDTSLDGGLPSDGGTPGDGGIPLERRASISPRVAVAPTGDAVVVWSQETILGPATPPYNPTARRYVSGTGWEASPQILESYMGDTQAIWPEVALVADKPIALWAKSGPAFHSRTTSYVPNSGWTTPISLASSPNAELAQIAPHIAGNANGTGLAVFAEYGSSTTSVFADRYTSAGGWTAPIAISKPSASVDEIAAAIDSSGAAIALFAQPHGAASELWVTGSDAAGAWRTPELLATPITNAFGLNVAFDTDGNAFTAWAQRDGANSAIWASRYVPGQGWATPQLIQTTVQDGIDPRMVVDARGHAIVVWYEVTGGSKTEIWMNRYIAGVGWGTSSRLPTGSAYIAVSPVVAEDAQGHITLMWTGDSAADGSASVTNVQAMRFE